MERAFLAPGEAEELWLLSVWKRGTGYSEEMKKPNHREGGLEPQSHLLNT